MEIRRVVVPGPVWNQRFAASVPVGPPAAQNSGVSAAPGMQATVGRHALLANPAVAHVPPAADAVVTVPPPRASQLVRDGVMDPATLDAFACHVHAALTVGRLERERLDTREIETELVPLASEMGVTDATLQRVMIREYLSVAWAYEVVWEAYETILALQQELAQTVDPQTVAGLRTQLAAAGQYYTRLHAVIASVRVVRETIAMELATELATARPAAAALAGAKEYVGARFHPDIDALAGFVECAERLRAQLAALLEGVDGPLSLPEIPVPAPTPALPLPSAISDPLSADSLTLHRPATQQMYDERFGAGHYVFAIRVLFGSAAMRGVEDPTVFQSEVESILDSTCARADLANKGELEILASAAGTIDTYFDKSKWLLEHSATGPAAAVRTALLERLEQYFAKGRDPRGLSAKTMQGWIDASVAARAETPARAGENDAANAGDHPPDPPPPPPRPAAKADPVALALQRIRTTASVAPFPPEAFAAWIVEITRRELHRNPEAADTLDATLRARLMAWADLRHPETLLDLLGGEPIRPAAWLPRHLQQQWLNELAQRVRSMDWDSVDVSTSGADSRLEQYVEDLRHQIGDGLRTRARAYRPQKWKDTEAVVTQGGILGADAATWTRLQAETAALDQAVGRTVVIKAVSEAYADERPAAWLLERANQLVIARRREAPNGPAIQADPRAVALYNRLLHELDGILRIEGKPPPHAFEGSTITKAPLELHAVQVLLHLRKQLETLGVRGTAVTRQNLGPVIGTLDRIIQHCDRSKQIIDAGTMAVDSQWPTWRLSWEQLNQLCAVLSLAATLLERPSRSAATAKDAAA